MSVPAVAAVSTGANNTSSTATTTSAPATTSTDLTSQLLPHLDRHLVLPLLDFLESRGTYSHDEVLKAKYDLLKPTNMVTYVLGLKRELEGTSEDAQVPEGESLNARRSSLDRATGLAGSRGGYITIQYTLSPRAC